MNAPAKLKAVEATEIPESTAPHVLQAINAVMAEISRTGIAKDRRNTTQNYDFRGIDDVYNVLCGIIAENRLVITPKCLSRSRETFQTQKGGTMFSVTVEVEYEFASSLDGSSKVVGPFYGEAMDSGDKATNKAMSAAYKYMAMQEFCIPTKGDNDADAHSHQLASAEELAINLLKASSADKALFKEAWEKNRAGWKNVLDGPAYARVVKAMKEIAATFPKDDGPQSEPSAPAPPPPESRPISSRAQAPAEDFGIGDDEIPAEFR